MKSSVDAVDEDGSMFSSILVNQKQLLISIAGLKLN